MSQYSPKKRYYLKDNLAYTEDHVLVKSLFLMNVSPGLEPSHLRWHFEKYGRVLRLHLFHGDSRKKLRFGYVSFANPHHATKALERKVHYVNGRRLCVQPSDSWHQPDAKENHHKLENTQTQATDNAAIMMLNDHCLEHILIHLSLVDRIHFARSCSRFRNVYIGMSPQLDKTIQFDEFEPMTVWDLRDFFQLSGCNVKHIEGIIPKSHCKRLCEFLGIYCINLKSMRIMANSLTKGNMYKLFAKLKNLESLQMRGCNLSEDSLQPLRILGQLKRLDLSHNDRLLGEFRLPETIECLTLTNCTGIDPQRFPKMLEEVKQIKELHAKGIYLSKCAQQLFTHKCCESLEALTISLDDNRTPEIDYIAQLPSLKKLILHFHYDGETLPQMINSLVTHKSKQLEHLEIRSHNSIGAQDVAKIGNLSALRTLSLPTITDSLLETLFTLQELEEISMKYPAHVTDNGIVRLILACPKLRVLHLQGCVQLTDKLLKDLIAKLQRNPSKRTLPIKLYLSGNNDKLNIQENADEAIKNIVDVSYTSKFVSDFSSLHDALLDHIDEDDSSFDSDYSYNSDIYDFEQEYDEDFLSDFEDAEYFDFGFDMF